jgi:hypothetical protein
MRCPRFALHRFLVLTSLLVASGAAAATKPVEFITQGAGPASLTVEERAKAAAHGIAIATPAAAATYASVPPLPLRIEARPIGYRPHDAGAVREARP